MKNRFDEKVKGHGFFRKTKAFGLASGIALGAALLIGANTVSADEATPAQPTTTAQPTSSDEKTEVVTVKEAELKAKVDEAKKAGVEVVEKPAVSVGTATNDADAKKLEAEATKKVDAEIKALDDAKVKLSSSKEQISKINEVKDAYLKSPNQGDFTFEQLAKIETKSLVENTNNLSKIQNLTSSKGSVDYVGGKVLNNIDDTSITNAVKGLISNTPVSTVFHRDTKVYDKQDPEDPYLKLVSKSDIIGYLVKHSANETLSYDLSISKDSDLYKKYGISTISVNEKLAVSKGVPQEINFFTFVSPIFWESKNVFIDNSAKVKVPEGEKIQVEKEYIFKDENGRALDFKKLAQKIVNDEVFQGVEIVKITDYKDEKLYNEFDLNPGKVFFAAKSGKIKEYEILFKTNPNNVVEFKTILTIGENFSKGVQFLTGYEVGKGMHNLDNIKVSEVVNSTKVEVSPVTYTRATAITTTYVPNDKLNPGETKVIDDGKQSGKKVIEVGTKPSEKVEETPFKEETRPNPALPEGERKVVQEGVKGRKVTRTTYTLDTKTGKVTPKEEVTENTAAKNRIVEVGTKKPDSVTEGELVTVYRPNDKLEAGKQNEVDPGKKSKLVNGKETEAGKPRIIEVGTKPVVVEKEIPFKETVVQNPSKPEGTRTVLKEGKVGKETTTTTYTLDTKTGKVTPDTKTTVVKAEDRLVEVGTGKNVTGDVETQYVPDPELEPGKTKVVQEGTPEVKDVTGKVLTPGKPTIIHIGTKPKVVEEELPFKEEVRENKDLPKGERKVVQEGKVGKKVTTTTYMVDPKTGKVTSEDKVEETAAVNKIIEVGTKEEVKATPAPQAPAAPKAQLPHTGTEASLALTLAGLAVAGIATTMIRKKKEE